MQPVLTHCDKMMAEHARDKSVRAFEDACAQQASWFRDALARHQAAQLVRDGFKPLKVQDKVICVSCIAGGDATLLALRTHLEEMVLTKPPMLPSVGQTIPRTWLQAMAFLRALRDGRDAVSATRSAVPSAAEVERMERGLGDGTSADAGTGLGFALGARPYMTMIEAEHIWLNDVVPALDVEADATVMHDALQLLVNQGEVFSSSGIIYLQPDYITRLLKPLVDHRLTRSRFQQTLGTLPGDAETQQRRAALLLPACDIFVRTGELREELLPAMWQPLGLHSDDYGDVMVMLATSGVVFLAHHEEHGRRWVMPLRLPENRPSEPYEQWVSMMDLEVTEHMAVGYRLGRFAPPGITERLTAACKGLGEYYAFWKRGAILNTTLAQTQLLLEMRTTMVPGSVSGEIQARHELCIELRGPKGFRSQMWLLLLRVQEVTEKLLEDFPGIYPDGLAYCPGCLRSEEHREHPHSWPLADVCSKHVKCEACGEALALHVVRLSKESKEVDLFSPGLFVTPPRMVLTEAAGGGEDSARSHTHSANSSLHGANSFKRQMALDKPGQPPVLEVEEEGIFAGAAASSPPTAHLSPGSPSQATPVGLAGLKRAATKVISQLNTVEALSLRKGEGKSEASTDTLEESSNSRAAVDPTAQEKVEEAERRLLAAKFVSRRIRFGRPIESGVGLHKLLGLVSEEDLNGLMKLGEGAIIDEFASQTSESRDSTGRTDDDWLNYIKDNIAEEQVIDGSAGLILDEGHHMMKLDDFVAHPTAVAAGLKRAHILALRLYTTSVCQHINQPLFVGCSPERPHPYPATVANICEALRRLRNVADEKSRADIKKAAGHPAASAGAGFEQLEAVTTLWRGVGDLPTLNELKARGGSELGFVSATSSRAVAEEQTMGATMDGAALSVLLKIRADVLNGVDVSSFAVFPCQAECLYPPATFLEVRTSWEETIQLPSGDSVIVHVVEALPRMGQLV